MPKLPRRQSIPKMIISLVLRLVNLRRWPPYVFAQRVARLSGLVSNDSLEHRLRRSQGLLGKRKDDRDLSDDDDDDRESLLSSLVLATIWIVGLLWAFASLRTWFSPPLPPALPGDDRWFAKLFPRGAPEVIIVTPLIFSNGTPAHVELTQANHAAYAERHGYALIALSKEMIDSFAHAKEMQSRPRHPVWYKITGAMFLMRLLRTFAAEKTVWIWLLDSDTVITDPSKSLMEVLPELKSGKWEMAMTIDVMGLNAGSWVVKSDAWTERLFDRLWENEIPGHPLRGWSTQYRASLSIADHDPHWELEQEALKQLYAVDRDLILKTLIVEQHRINAYPSDYWNMMNSQNTRPWEAGDFREFLLV